MVAFSFPFSFSEYLHCVIVYFDVRVHPWAPIKVFMMGHLFGLKISGHKGGGCLGGCWPGGY